MEIYLISDEGKPEIAKQFIATLNNKIVKCMSLVLKDIYINKLP